MKRKIELLAPGGDVDSIKAAIAAGADAVYCGLIRFNARNRAKNIGFDDLNGIISLAHRNDCKAFLTINIVIVGSEIPALVQLLNKLVNTDIDGVIVQDFGLLYLISEYFPSLKIHASTQLTTHNKGQIKFLSKLSAARVNLSRELSINEIKALAETGHENNILTEIFVHGSYCIGFSGICYLSSVHGGNSGNRGRCSQPCRDRYLTTPEGRNFPLNLKDNSAYFDLQEIYRAGVDSVKIEGRMKNFDYVYTVVNCWKKQIEMFFNQNKLSNDNKDLYKVFNRDFSNSYLKGNINKDMFIDSPRDHSIKQFSSIDDNPANKKLLREKEEYYKEKEANINNIKKIIKQSSIAKIPLVIVVFGELGTLLKVSVKTRDISFDAFSETKLKKSGRYTINYDYLFKILKVLNNTEYYIKNIELNNLQKDLFVPFKELTLIKKRIFSCLNNSRELIDYVDIPVLKKQSASKIKPKLGILISSEKDLYLCEKISADIFFQLPNCYNNKVSELIDLFLKNKKLIPWFPSVLIGENYTAAVKFLQQVQPEFIVTNNTGIAYEASEKGIPWIAGPYLNIANSYSLVCLKEKFNCGGAFVSNELNKFQIKSIINPEDFKLYYSIYHPVFLLSSRQCLLHQVIGCEKDTIDEECLQKCEKSASITNLKKIPLLIKKTKGHYHCIYNNINFLNTDIISDFPDMFSSFFIDLRDIRTHTEIEMDKLGIINLFENCIKREQGSKKKLNQIIHPSTNVQYEKGI